MSKGELIQKIQEYGKLCKSIGYEESDHARGHSDVDPALVSKCKKKLDEIIQVVWRIA